ncbi:MAG: tetratricopeptide repeat protein [Oligoflexales bacterium]
MTAKHQGKAIIYCLRDDLRTVIRSILKSFGFEAGDVHNVRAIKEYQAKAEELGKENYLLILDWEIGVENIFEVFKIEEKEKYAYAVPCMLIASTIDAKILSVATEFNVAKTHFGEITPELMKGSLQDFISEGMEKTALKTLYQEVDKLKEDGDWIKASKILEELTKKFPENEKLHIDYAESLFEQNLLTDAQAEIAKIKNPKNARSRHMQARIYLKLGDSQKAAAALQDAQILNPLNINRLLEMGNLFLSMADPEKAKNAFEQVLKVAPDSKQAKSGKSSSMLLSGEINEAIAMVRDSFSPRETAAVFNTAAIFAIKGKQFDEAINLYKTAIEFIGQNTKIKSRLYFNMGIGYYKRNDSPEALKCFSQAVKFDGEFQDAKFNLELMQKKDSNKVTIATSDNADDIGKLEESIGRALESGLSASNFDDIEDVEE